MSSYRGAIAWLNENHPFFVTPLINLGKPVENYSPGHTLAVIQYGNDIQLSVNPEFLHEHTEEECAGLLAHELYHVVMNHLAEQDNFENKKAMTIAHECIVNDSVLEEGMVLPDSAILGMNVVQYNTSFLPTRVVYDDLLKKAQESGDGDNSPEDMEPNCSHDGEPIDARAVFNLLFSGANIDEAPESLKVHLENAAEKAGTGFSFSRKTNTGRKINLKWTELINQIHPETFTDGGKSKAGSTWARPRRKLAGMQNRVMLPDRKDFDQFGTGGNRRPKIVLALDTSGSIPTDMQQELLDLANSIPKRKVDVRCCTFSTEYVKLDIDQDLRGQKIAHGGTDFDAVAAFVKSENLDENIHVIVITDGWARFGYGIKSTPPKLDTNWHWLVIGRPKISDERVKNNIYSYQDYVG